MTTQEDLLEQLGDARDKYNEAILFIDYLRAKLEYYPNRYENTIEAVVGDIRETIDRFKQEGKMPQSMRLCSTILSYFTPRIC